MRRRKALWTVGVVFVLFLLLTFGGGRYLVQRFVEELATHYHVSVTVEDVTPLFLGFVLRNVAVEGKGFSFRAPSLCARLSWTRGITLVIVDGEFSLPRGYSFPLESLPPFLLEIRKGRFAEFPDVLWDGRFEKSGDCLRFRVTAGDLDLAGDIRGEVVTVLSPFQGTFSLKTGAFSGVFKDVRFEGMLSRKGDAWQIAPFLVMGTEGTFSGKCVFHKDMLFDLSGNVCAFGMEMPFTLSGRLAFPLLEGEFRSEGLLGRVVADLLRASYRLTIYPQSVWQDCRVSGILEGRFREGFTARFRDFSVDIPQREISFAFSGELEGKGDILRGSVRLRNFTGRIKGWELSEGEFVVCLDGPRVSFSGQGKLFGGCVNLSGEYGKGRFWVLGKAKDIPVERVVGKSDVPLSGVISGDFSLEGEWDNLKISLALNDGHLFLQGRDLGSVASGKAEVRGDAFFLKDLLLVRKGGRFSGTFVKGATGIQGEGTFDAYPLEFSWQGRDIRVLLHGSVAFRWGEERFLRFALSAPSWSFGAFEGRDLHAIGELQDGRVTLGRLSLLWDGGFLKVQGNFVPGKAVHLEGEVENLRIPEKDFPVSGTVEKARFLVSGPWEDVCWVLEGKGSSLRTADFPLGEEVILKLSGRVSLARVFEEQSPVLEVLHPENLTEGSITVRRVNLALFGGTFFSKVPGTFDMYLVLDRQKRLWRFSSDTVIFSFPPYGSFKVGFQGTYDGQRLVLENVRVEGEQGTVLSGKGNMDVATRSLDLWVSGRIKTLLSFGDYRIDLEAEGQWHAFGDVVFPSLEGSLYLPRVRIFGGSREYLVLEDLRGEMAGDALRFSGGKGRFPWGRLTKVEGMVRSDGFLFSGDFEGEGSFPGLEGIFQGRWSGKLTLSGAKERYVLEGEAVVSQASIDVRKIPKERIASISLFSESFGQLPVSVRLRIALQDALLVKTDFLHLLLSGDVSLRFEEGKLSLSGKFDVLEGMYDLVVCTIPLEGYIAFTGLGGYVPELHLEGWKSVQGYDIRVRVSGTLSDYKVDLVAEPALSKEEILSLLLFGDKDAHMALHRVNLTPLLVKVARFFLKGGGTFRAEPFFDAMTFDLRDFSRLTFEKRLGKDVAIGYTQNLMSGESSLAVDVDFGKEWSFRLERKESGETEWMLQFSTKF